MIREKLMASVLEGKVADWFILVKYLGDSREFQYNGKNVAKINEEEVKDFQIVHKSVLFPPKKKKEEIKVTDKMTKNEIREKLEGKGIVLSNTVFKKTLRADLLEQLEAVIAKEMASGIRPVIKELKKITKAGGKIEEDQQKLYRKLANNKAAEKYGIQVNEDKGQYVVGAKLEKYVVMFLIDPIGVLRVYKNKKVVWKRLSVACVDDSTLFFHVNKMIEGHVVTPKNVCLDFKWDSNKWDLPYVTIEGKTVMPGIRKKAQNYVKKVILDGLKPKKEIEKEVVAPSTENDGLPFDINA